jgi:hypothetical protein
MPTTRQQVGVALRFPVVLILAVLWLVYFWWWIAGFGVGFALLMLVLQPLAYPLIWGLSYLYLAFENSSEPTLPDYWKHYPDYWFDLSSQVVRLGFPTLGRWLKKGF